MSTSATATRFGSDSLWVDLSDGRVIAVPMGRFPRLLKATPEQHAQVDCSARGLHWESLDEDIAVEGLLAGVGNLAQQVSLTVR